LKGCQRQDSARYKYGNRVIDGEERGLGKKNAIKTGSHKGGRNLKKLTTLKELRVVTVSVDSLKEQEYNGLEERMREDGGGACISSQKGEARRNLSRKKGRNRNLQRLVFYWVGNPQNKKEERGKT